MRFPFFQEYFKGTYQYNANKFSEKHILFRFVPTFRCNLHCPYCFFPKSNGSEPTMFDKYSSNNWIDGLKKWKNYDIEFYLTGGEPFVLDETYDLVKGFTSMSNVKWARIDHNMTKIDDILKRCKSPKVKLLCSWHAYAHKFNEIWPKINELKDADMVGMVNFVASKENLIALKKQDLELDSLIRLFDDNGIFLNVAGDFYLGDDPNYRQFIIKYTTPEDWDNIHGKVPCYNCKCGAGKHFYTVDHDGSISVCIINKKVGNFFEGALQRDDILCSYKGQESCGCIISYCNRLDNNFMPMRHLDDYVRRNNAYRKKIGLI